MECLLITTALLFADFGQTRYIATHEKHTVSIAELAENSLTFLKAHFEGVDTALAIYRIRNGVHVEEKKEGWRKYVENEYSEFMEH